MTRFSIRRRLVLIGVTGVMAIAAATGLVIEMQRVASIDAYRTATANLGNGMAEHTRQQFIAVDQVLSELRTDLTSMPDQTFGGIGAALRTKATFDRLVEQGKRLSTVESLSLVDAEGRVANHSRMGRFSQQSVADTDYFAHFSRDDDHDVFISTPSRSLLTGDWVALMTRRMNTAQGQFAGLVVAEISLANLEDFYRLAMRGRYVIALERSDGVILLHYPPRDSEIGMRIADESPWYATVAQRGGQYQARAHGSGVPVIASVHPLRGLPLVVETSATESDALSEWHRHAVWLILGGIGASLCMVGLLRLFGNQLGRLERSDQLSAANYRALESVRQQMDAALTNLSQGVCFFSGDQKLIVCNRRYAELYHIPPDAIRPGITLTEVAKLRFDAGSFPQATISDYLESRDAVARGDKPHHSVIELKDGRTIAINHQPMPDGGWVATHEDITSRREAEAKIAFLARHDVLTGLANRALFQERLEQALAMAERGKGFALLCLDLDRFKAVNDTLGHAMGDALLRTVASRLVDTVRESDTVARLGGDEFAILQLGVSAMADTTVLARRIVQMVSQPYDLEGNQAVIGISIGIALAPGDGSHPLQLMRNADLALYKAKQEGRGTWRLFEQAMDTVAQSRRALELDLRSAMTLGQLELHYQPMVCSRRRVVTGFEALLRWHHPSRGLVMPGEFISIAEEIGLINQIGAQVLQQACLEAATWPPHLRVAVNLSPRQFRGQALAGSVEDALRAAGLAPERLELEITESVPLLDDQVTVEILHQLRALGVRIALDDFGTGYSSLSYLRSFPFDTIKIDRVFVKDLQTRDDCVAIVKAVAGLAGSLHMNTTAEGVESEEQFEFLATAGCTEIQGYLFSKPVPAAAVPALIARLSEPPPPAALSFAASSAGS